MLYKKILSSGREFEGQQEEMSMGPEKLSGLLCPLDNFAVYEISVLGFNIRGDGIGSDTLYAGKTKQIKMGQWYSWGMVYANEVMNITSVCV